MNQSGEAAEQVIRLVVNGAEEAVKISGQAAYHLIALLTSSLKSDKKGRRKLSAGKTRLLNLLRDGSQLKIFSLRPNDIRAFQRKAKKYKIQYAIVKNKRSGHADVVARVADVDLINRVMLGMGYGREESLSREPDARAEAIRSNDLKKRPSTKGRIREARHFLDETAGGGPNEYGPPRYPQEPYAPVPPRGTGYAGPDPYAPPPLPPRGTGRVHPTATATVPGYGKANGLAAATPRGGQEHASPTIVIPDGEQDAGPDGPGYTGVAQP